jgi:hypothetical protein
MENQLIKICESQKESIIELNGSKLKNLLSYTFVRSVDNPKRAKIILEIDIPFEEIKFASLKEK